MRRPARLPRIFRQVGRQWYIISAIYAALGVLVVLLSLLSFEWSGVLVGFLGGGMVLCTAIIVSTVTRLSTDMATLRTTLREVRSRIVRIEDRLPADAADAGEQPGARMEMNLAAVGRGDPASLAAVTLDRSMYPRLVTAMEDEPPAVSTSLPRRGDQTFPEEFEPTQPAMGVTTKNLLRTWVIALRERDLATCREVYATLVDTADPTTVVSLATQLQQLSDQVERGLRQAFSQRVRDRDYAGALEAGEKIRNLWPDGSAARDFERIRPYLLRRVI